MGRQDIQADLDPREFRGFTRALLTDLRTLEQMLCTGRFETGIRRIGAEQELFLVDAGWRPAPVVTEVLAGLTGAEFTTELARFNLEINIPPLTLGGRCFATLHERLRAALAAVREETRRHGAEVVLTGILPTLSKSDLGLENLTPKERYRALNTALSRMCGAIYRLHIQGTDELHIEHDSVMLEGCNSSFQIHLQVTPDEFPRFYNVAQAIAGPVLAASVNSPLLFGKRLWAETRIALFQQAIDTRGATPYVRDLTPRVRFGERWVRHSILELFQEDIARIPALVGTTVVEDSAQRLRDGHTPELRALQVYNSTVYRWNRPCYGVLNGVPHLRIECRYLPSGPSVEDEIGNAALWIGLMLGGIRTFGDIHETLGFEDVRGNFLAAGRRGLRAGLTWAGASTVGAAQLLLDELLPVAHDGLRTSGVADEDREHYLGIVEERIRAGATGAWWLERSLCHLGRSGTRAERMAALTAAMAARQAEDSPVHHWPLAELAESGGWRHHYVRVEQFMTTDLFTVREDEVVDLAALLMDWRQIRQVPVEDEHHHLVGLVDYASVLRLLAARRPGDGDQKAPVRDIMRRDPPTVTPTTTTLDAIKLMREKQVTCLPVVQDGTLVGIVSVGDFMPIAERLLESCTTEP